MPSAVRQRLVTAALLLGALIASDAASAGDVTIYRCVGAGNQIALQDHPCPKDARQDVRQMIRPQDPPPRPPPVAVATPLAPPAVEIRVVHVRDPQPLYECRNADSGETYLSQTGVPESRYVPFWTLGLGDGLAQSGERKPPPQVHGRLPHGHFAYPPVVYVEDTCVRLPQNEVCQRLRARNDALGTLIFNGQPSERERYERERKGLLEQMRNDCDATY
jgi:hypothetical protein